MQLGVALAYCRKAQLKAQCGVPPPAVLQIGASGAKTLTTQIAGTSNQCLWRQNTDHADSRYQYARSIYLMGALLRRGTKDSRPNRPAAPSRKSVVRTKRIRPLSGSRNSALLM